LTGIRHLSACHQLQYGDFKATSKASPNSTEFILDAFRLFKPSLLAYSDQYQFRQNSNVFGQQDCTTPPYQTLLIIGRIVRRITYQIIPSLSVTLILVVRLSPDRHDDFTPLFLAWQQPSRGQEDGIVTTIGGPASDGV
jgi:hypothetical protein